MSGPRDGKASRAGAAADDAWSRYTDTVRPLRARKPEAREAAPAPAVAPRPTKAQPPVAPVRRPPAEGLAIGAAPAGLDRANWERLRSGRMPAARRLDLHGHTAAAAHGALGRFLEQAAADGVRCVEIVTGRGVGPEGGVLRRELPHWLNAPALRPLILGAAHPHPANPGAVRVLLRRAKARDAQGAKARDAQGAKARDAQGAKARKNPRDRAR
jgi:DNA-nicking Smr family endonuclease